MEVGPGKECAAQLRQNLLLSFQLQMRKQIQWESDNWCCLEILHTWQRYVVWWLCSIGWILFTPNNPPFLTPWPLWLVWLSHNSIYLCLLPVSLWPIRFPQSSVQIPLSIPLNGWVCLWTNAKGPMKTGGPPMRSLHWHPCTQIEKTTSTQSRTPS